MIHILQIVLHLKWPWKDVMFKYCFYFNVIYTLVQSCILSKTFNRIDRLYLATVRSWKISLIFLYCTVRSMFLCLTRSDFLVFIKTCNNCNYVTLWLCAFLWYLFTYRKVWLPNYIYCKFSFSLITI